VKTKMRIVHAIDSPNIVKEIYKKFMIKLCILISYIYLKGNFTELTKTDRDMIELLYLDSSAFTANKQNLDIRHEYWSFIKHNWQFFDQHVNYDDRFDDHEHNLYNQMYLEENLPREIRKPMPVLHDIDNPFEELKMYIDLGYKYVALGSGNKKVGNNVLDIINSDYPDIYVHVFGRLDLKMLETYKPYSADASTYAMEAAKGGILYWDKEKKRRYQVYVGGREKPIDAKITHFRSFMKRNERFRALMENTFGYSHYDLLTDYTKRQMVNIYFFKQFEDYVNGT